VVMAAFAMLTALPLILLVQPAAREPSATAPTGSPRPLPAPRTSGPVSLEEALAERRSVRSFADAPLTDAEVGQLLWAAQGVTDESGLRTAPSAGARYPLETYAVTADGAWRYVPDRQALEPVLAGDVRPDLQRAALGQEAVGAAPLVVVISADIDRTASRYGAERAPRYVHLEAGHAAQNVLLQAVALGLGSVPIGAFSDADVARVLRLPPDEIVLYLLPVGRPG
jgi:SagB-type dehydrogenase family enzyme